MTSWRRSILVRRDIGAGEEELEQYLEGRGHPEHDTKADEYGSGGEVSGEKHSKVYIDIRPTGEDN